MTPTLIGPVTQTNPKPLDAPKKLTPPPAALAAVKAFEVKPKSATLKKVIVAKTLADPSSGYVKSLFFGHSGTGKSKVITGYLLHGLKVFVISTDIGGEGLNTIRMDLKTLNRQDLLANCTFVELEEYDEVEAFVEDPTSIYPPFYTEDFDVLFWDGLSAWQQIQLDKKVLEMAPMGGNNGEAREAGLWATTMDWGAIKRASCRNLDAFLQIHNKLNGRRIHKTVTCLESGKPTEDKLTGITQKAPLIQGAAGALIGPAFDIVAHTRVKRVGDGDKKTEQYVYEMIGTDKLMVKSRGLKLESTEPADFYELWKKITNQLGIPSGRVAL